MSRTGQSVSMRQRVVLIVYYTLFRHFPRSYSPLGHFSRGLRNWAARQVFEECSRTANVEHGCHFGTGIALRVGDRSSLGVNSEIHGPVRVGNDVMMGPNTLIHTENHAFERIDIPMIEQGYSARRPVVIEDDVWIGARVIILPGVTIGKGSIIGAGSVVAKSIPPHTIAVGNPCRPVRNRASIV